MRFVVALAIGAATGLLVAVIFHAFGWNDHNLALIPICLAVLAGYLGWRRGETWFHAK